MNSKSCKLKKNRGCFQKEKGCPIKKVLSDHWLVATMAAIGMSVVGAFASFKGKCWGWLSLIVGVGGIMVHCANGRRVHKIRRAKVDKNACKPCRWVKDLKN